MPAIPACLRQPDPRTPGLPKRILRNIDSDTKSAGVDNTSRRSMAVLRDDDCFAAAG